MRSIKLILEEIDKHLSLLSYEEAKLKEKMPLDKEDLNNYELLILLDAFIFRFIKVQSSMGEKLFPILFEILTGKPYTEVSFIDILNTLEKYGFLESADNWNKLRKLRNEFVHIYPWETEQRVEAIEKALDVLPFIRRTFEVIKDYVRKKNLW